MRRPPGVTQTGPLADQTSPQIGAKIPPKWALRSSDCCNRHCACASIDGYTELGVLGLALGLPTHTDRTRIT